MKFCRSCFKAWTEKNTVPANSDFFWANIKTAELTFCGCCLKKLAVWFDLQMEPKRTLRLEGRK